MLLASAAVAVTADRAYAGPSLRKAFAAWSLRMDHASIRQLDIDADSLMGDAGMTREQANLDVMEKRLHEPLEVWLSLGVRGELKGALIDGGQPTKLCRDLLTAQ
jgi:uncharacterized protein YjiS (DUF1127 family)